MGHGQILDIPDIIDRVYPCGSSTSPGKVLTDWSLSGVIDPESATQLEACVKTPDIPRLSGIAEGL